MEDSVSANGFLMVPPCYIKEELDISNVTDYSDMEDDDSGSFPANTVDRSHCDKEPTSQIPMSNGETGVEDSVGLEKSETRVLSNISNDHVAIMKEESDDTDVDVENDSSDLELNNKNLPEESSWNTRDESAWENESSDNESFELKMSDESSDEAQNDDNANEVVDKNISKTDSEKLDSNEGENKIYVTRNRSKTLTPTIHTDSNSDNLMNGSHQSESQLNDNKIITRNSLRGSATKNEEYGQTGVKQSRRIKRNDAMVRFCVKCNITSDMKVAHQKVFCTNCKIVMQIKCLLCKDKDHLTKTYCGLRKHLLLHHVSKKAKQRRKTNLDTSPQKASVDSQKSVYNRELLLADIEKFTILICLKCNEVARVYNGLISDCGQCKVKMVLTCLICCKYEATIRRMYEHLHEEHKEHFSETQDGSSTPANHQIDAKNNKSDLVKSNRCMKCRRRFFSHATAYKHALQCTNNPKIRKCDYCTYQTQYSCNLKKHCLSMHNKVLERKINNRKSMTTSIVKPKRNQCRLCGKIMLSQAALGRHEKYCGVEPNLKCEFCPYKTKFKGNLNVHLNMCRNKNRVDAAEPTESKETPTVQKILPAPDTAKSQVSNYDTVGVSSEIPTVRPLDEVAKICCINCNETSNRVSTYKESACQKCRKIMRHQCQICKKSYNQYQSLIYHLDSVCNPSASFECLQCDYKTSVYNLIHKHLRTHGLDPNTFANKKEATNNVFRVVKFRKASSNNDPQPEETLAKSPAKPSISNGMSSPEEAPTTNNPFTTVLKTQCPQCKMYVLRIKAHLQFCGLEANIKCRFCPYKTKYIQNLKTHVKNHHKNVKKLKNRNLSNDQKVESKAAPNVDSQEQNGHIRNKEFRKESGHVKAEDLMQSYCSKCDASKETMKYASKCRVCDTQLIYRCAKCNQEYPTREVLRAHVRSHWDKPHVCSGCRKAFGHAGNLRMHEKICMGVLESRWKSRRLLDQATALIS